jgi:hypothetical protein
MTGNLNEPSPHRPGSDEARPSRTKEVKGRHMARALLGYVGNSNDQMLAVEVGRLRRRVEELESQLAELRASSQVVTLDLELHRIAESAEPALT